jgi:hypothetical protein
MRNGAFLFSGNWMPLVKEFPETGMGYTVVSVTLTDGRRFSQALLESGCLSRVRGLPDVPFSEKDIAEIKPTHEKWNWREEP